MSEQKWVRSSLLSLSRRLTEAGHPASSPTVGRLLQKLGFALHVNAKKREASDAHPDRRAQFAYMTRQMLEFVGRGQPVISVDTKKKERVGDCKNAGSAWSQEAEAVLTHDFPQDARGRAVPYGIYDLQHNCGAVAVGRSGDTPQFAVEAIARWWEQTGLAVYPTTAELLILADAGGSNSYQARGWKRWLQELLSGRFGLAVTVGHYPSGCSKWNPIEHRLLSFISLNWRGKPLRTWETLLNCLRWTATETGLTVEAWLVEQDYPTGQTVPDPVMKALALERHAVCPKWNYTLHPRTTNGTASTPASASGEVIL